MVAIPCRVVEMWPCGSTEDCVLCVGQIGDKHIYNVIETSK